MKMHLVFKCCFIFDLMIVNFLSNALSLMNQQVVKLPTKFPCHWKTMSRQARTYSHIFTLASSAIEPSPKQARHLEVIFTFWLSHLFLFATSLSLRPQAEQKYSVFSDIWIFHYKQKFEAKFLFLTKKTFLTAKNWNISQLIRSSGCLNFHCFSID